MHLALAACRPWLPDLLRDLVALEEAQGCPHDLAGAREVTRVQARLDEVVLLLGN